MRWFWGLLWLCFTIELWADTPDLARLGVSAARLRQLAYRPVPLVARSRSQIEREVCEWLAEKTSAEEEARWSHLLRLLDLMPPGESPLRLRQAQLREQVRGYYDARQGHFALVQDGSGAVLEEATALHELIHAIQDQHFELLPLLRGYPGQFDRSLAALCLVEGDANSAMVDFLLESAGLASQRQEQPPPNFSGLGEPLFFRGSLVFPYLFGQHWVEQLRLRSGWQGVNDAFQSPPQSTEQIFHPEKYPGDVPMRVELEVQLNPGERSLGQDTGGEFTFRCWAQARGAEAEVAAGWGGDRLEVVEGPGGSRVLWRTRWDTQRDALEFRQFVARQKGVGAVELQDTRVDFELREFF